MRIPFSKMHGTGNDYVYVNCMERAIKNPSELSRIVSDRRFGVGSDGLILILPSERADFRMRIFNADGSEGRMCGNGIRCVGKYVYDTGLTHKRHLTVETLSGRRELWLHPDGSGTVSTVTVDMGKAILQPEKIPIRSDLERFVNQPVEVCGSVYRVTCVSMGNPHAVVFCEDVERLDLAGIGPEFEHHMLFPERVNAEFVQVVDAETLKMRVWERGSGETFACGTGACASVVAAVLNGYCRRDTDVTVNLRGGTLHIRYQSDDVVMMTGAATHVFDGSIECSLQEGYHGETQ